MCNQILTELIQGYLLLFLVAILATVRGWSKPPATREASLVRSESRWPWCHPAESCHRSPSPLSSGGRDRGKWSNW